jgi:murein DD-endopeptidase MepM/ murein hydrolase activator NlpD
MHKGKILFGAHSHLKRKPKWKSGDKISATDIAGLVGNTGSCSKGAHDHLTIGTEATHVFAGKTIDPLKVLEF